MEALVELINQNVQWAPFMVCGLLLLAGLNFPVSEDLMIFISALLAAKYPDYIVYLYVGVFTGAYVSDVISYGLGRFLGPKVLEIKIFQNMVTEERIAKINYFYEHYGIVTLVLGRFIPFGVRNGLFMTAGFSKMNAVKFCLADFCAAVISVTSFFTLYYIYGEAVVSFVKQFNIVVFAVAIVVVAVLWYRKSKMQKTTSV